MLVTVNNRLKFEIEIVHDLSCHPIEICERDWHKVRKCIYQVSRLQLVRLLACSVYVNLSGASP